jgi:hypothetical protein
MSKIMEVKHMPARNGTGPMGQGPMTGRGMGPCNGRNTFYGRGFRRGLGVRNGYGRGFASVSPSKDELKQEKEDLQRRIDEINQALE